MNQLQIFNNDHFGEVRVTEVNGEPLFCLADVCRALELTPSKVAQRLSKDVLSKYPLCSNGGEQLTNFINEDGLYDVILDSRKPEAKKFRKWITSEVLPTIRKTGRYEVQAVNAPSYQIDDPIRRAEMWIEEQRQKQLLQLENKAKTEQIEVMSAGIIDLKKKTEYTERILQCRGTVTVTQIAQDYGMSAKAFNKILAEAGIQRKVNGQWILYAPYTACGYVQSRTVNFIHRDGRPDVCLNTEWTQRGRLFLYERLKSRNVLPLIEQN